MITETQLCALCDNIIDYYEMMKHDRDYLIGCGRRAEARLYSNLIDEFQDLYDFAVGNGNVKETP